METLVIGLLKFRRVVEVWWQVNDQSSARLHYGHIEGADTLGTAHEIRVEPVTSIFFPAECPWLSVTQLTPLK